MQTNRGPLTWVPGAMSMVLLFWVIALTLAVWVAVGRSSGPIWSAASAAVYFAGSLICHQRPERSFHVLSVQLPICARCTGLYGGAALAACAAWMVMGRPGPGAVARARAILVVAAIPAATTVLYEWTTGVAPSNVVRAATGGLLGAAIVWLVVTFGTAVSPVEVN